MQRKFFRKCEEVSTLRKAEEKAKAESGREVALKLIKRGRPLEDTDLTVDELDKLKCEILNNSVKLSY